MTWQRQVRFAGISFYNEVSDKLPTTRNLWQIWHFLFSKVWHRYMYYTVAKSSSVACENITSKLPSELMTPSPSLSFPPWIPEIVHQFLNRTWYSWVFHSSIIFILLRKDLDFSLPELHQCNSKWNRGLVEFFWRILLQVLAFWPWKSETELPIGCLKTAIYHLCMTVGEALLKKKNCNSKWPVGLSQCIQAVDFLL